MHRRPLLEGGIWEFILYVSKHLRLSTVLWPLVLYRWCSSLHRTGGCSGRSGQPHLSTQYIHDPLQIMRLLGVLIMSHMAFKSSWNYLPVYVSQQQMFELNLQGLRKVISSNLGDGLGLNFLWKLTVWHIHVWEPWNTQKVGLTHWQKLHEGLVQYGYTCRLWRQTTAVLLMKRTRAPMVQ